MRLARVPAHQVVEQALAKLQARATATVGGRAIGVVRLFGLVHADERTAFKARLQLLHSLLL